MRIFMQRSNRFFENLKMNLDLYRRMIQYRKCNNVQKTLMKQNALWAFKRNKKGMNDVFPPHLSLRLHVFPLFKIKQIHFYYIIFMNEF